MPDYKEYLTTGDLRSTHDVVVWLGFMRGLATTVTPHELVYADEACDVLIGDLQKQLRDRLERERRRACRRGALITFKSASIMMRGYKEAKALGVIYDQEIEENIEAALSDALYLRAAART